MEQRKSIPLEVLMAGISHIGHPTRDFHPQTVDEYSPDPAGRWNCAEFIAVALTEGIRNAGLEPPKFLPITRRLINSNLEGWGSIVDKYFILPGDILPVVNEAATIHIVLVSGVKYREDKRDGVKKVQTFDYIHSRIKGDNPQVEVVRNAKFQKASRSPIRGAQQRYLQDIPYGIRPSYEDPKTLWRYEVIKS